MAAPNTDNLKKKRTYASNAVLYAFFIVGAIVLVNLIGTRFLGPLRVDLTQNKIYTLSQPSKDLVKRLPDYMTVKAFISNDLPPELKTVSRYVRDLIDEYKSSSNGKFKWEAIDPGADKKLEDEANRCKVQKLQIQVLRQQKFELGNYYMGLCLEYNGQVESIPQIARPEGLEYQVSSLIKRMTQKKRKIAFTTGHGEADINQGFQSLKQDLEQEYEVTTVNPSLAEVGADVDALVVGGPKQAIDEKGQKEIDKFLMKGKGAVFLVDGMSMNSPGGGMGMEQQMQIKMAQANDTGLNKLLETYGFKVDQNFVFDKAAMPGPIDIGGRRMLANAPFFVGAETNRDAKDLSVVEGVPGLVFPFASSVDLVGPLKDGKPKTGKLWKIASSSKESWLKTGFFVLSPGADLSPTDKEERKAYALGYALQAPLKSAFVQPTNESSKDAPPSESVKPVRLVVIGDSDFANDEYVQLARYLSFYGAGAQLLFNAISWTVEDEALTPLRSKTLNPRPIKLASEGVASALQWGNVLGLPLAFCLFGVLRWRVRRATRLGQKL